MSKASDDFFLSESSKSSKSSKSKERSDKTSDRASSGAPPYVERNAATGRFRRTAAGNLRAQGRMSRRSKRTGQYKLTRLGRGTRRFNPHTGRHDRIVASPASLSSSSGGVTRIKSARLRAGSNVDELQALIRNIQRLDAPYTVAEVRQVFGKVKEMIATIAPYVPRSQSDVRQFMSDVTSAPLDSIDMEEITDILEQFGRLLKPLLPPRGKISPILEAYRWIYDKLRDFDKFNATQEEVSGLAKSLQTYLRRVDPGSSFLARDPATVKLGELKAVADTVAPLAAGKARAVHGAAMVNLAAL